MNGDCDRTNGCYSQPTCCLVAMLQMMFSMIERKRYPWLTKCLPEITSIDVCLSYFLGPWILLLFDGG